MAPPGLCWRSAGWLRPGRVCPPSREPAVPQFPIAAECGRWASGQTGRAIRGRSRVPGGQAPRKSPADGVLPSWPARPGWLLPALGLPAHGCVPPKRSGGRAVPFLNWWYETKISGCEHSVTERGWVVAIAAETEERSFATDAASLGLGKPVFSKNGK